MEFKLASASAKQQWVTEFTEAYVRTSGFMPYMGGSDNNIIRVRDELKGSGNLINIPLVLKLNGAGVRDAQVLSGNEDDMGNANDQIRVSYRRNAVKFTKNETFKTELDLLGAAKPRLRNWAAESLRDEVIAAFGSVIVQGAVDADGFSTDLQLPYASASSAQRDAHLVNNTDRMAFVGGSSASGVMATALGTVTGTLSAAVLSAAKRKAKSTTTSAAAAITPYKTDATAGREWYVLFVDSLGFRDLQNDTQIASANTYARSREGNGMDNNPIFQGGDLIWDGVIIREVPELVSLTLKGQGSGGVDVGRAFLCGLSAITVAWGQNPTLTQETVDYGFRKGVGIEEIRGVKKTSFNGVEYGVVEIFYRENADTL
jgi:N4-gp56 family major capsid protein